MIHIYEIYKKPNNHLYELSELKRIIQTHIKHHL